MATFDPIQPPWDRGGDGDPAEFLDHWVRQAHRDGSTRLGALREVQRRLAPLGFRGCALLAGPWLRAEARVEGIHRMGPWDGVQAEVVGDIDESEVEAVSRSWFADPERCIPGASPRAFLMAGDPANLVVDLCIGGRRPGVAVFFGSAGAQSEVDWLLQAPATWWVLLGVAGLTRADWYWSHWDDVVEILVAGDEGPWDAGVADRPVNAQEVVVRVAELAERWVSAAAAAFQAATVGVFLPDAEEEYVWCLASEGGSTYAYDSGLVRRKPSVDTASFGLTAAWAATPPMTRRGRPVAVRALDDRKELRARYRDLGFDEDTWVPLSAAYTDPERLGVAQAGPWVFTAQRLPRALSPAARNLVVRFEGRTMASRWSTHDELVRTSRDRADRLAAVAMRIHADVVWALQEGLGLWREGLREDLLRELAGPRRLDALCRSVAACCSARSVTLWELDGRTLSLSAWSRPDPVPSLVLDTEERLDARELRLLQAPLFPRRDEVGGEGFLGWPPLEDALGGVAANVGTAPIVRQGRTVGLLRLDGGLSLFGGHLPRATHPSLHRHRPTVTPFHLRPVLEEVAKLIAAAGPHPRDAQLRMADWSGFVGRVQRGEIARAEAVAQLQRIHGHAPSQSRAAVVLGVHRNTLRRHLLVLREVLGPDGVPW